MGACFNIATTKEKPTQEWYDELIRQAEYECGHAGNYTGSFAEAIGTLGFPTTETFASFQDAEEWLGDHAEKWEPALAVPFKDVSEDGTNGIHWAIGAWCSS